jgi:hypothetical protein
MSMRHVENNIELLELSKSVAREKMSWVTAGQTLHAYLETQIGKGYGALAFSHSARAQQSRPPCPRPSSHIDGSPTPHPPIPNTAASFEPQHGQSCIRLHSFNMAYKDKNIKSHNNPKLDMKEELACRQETQTGGGPGPGGRLTCLER